MQAHRNYIRYLPTRIYTGLHAFGRICKWCEVSLPTLTQNVFRHGFTRTPSLRQAQGRLRAEPRDLHRFFGFIALIRAIRGCQSEEKASTIFTGLFKTKPILQRGRINVSSVLTRDYEEKTRFAGGSKQSQTKPISGKANAKMGKVYFSLRRTPPTFVGQACPCLALQTGRKDGRWQHECVS